VSSMLHATSVFIESSEYFDAGRTTLHLATTDSTSTVSALSLLCKSAKAVRVPMTPVAFKTAIAASLKKNVWRFAGR